MEWKDINTKKKFQIAQCKLEGPLSHGASSDGSIYLSIPLDGGKAVCVTVTYLPPKLANIGGKVTLVHPDKKNDKLIEQEWTVVSRGPVRWVNENGEILWGA